MGATPDVLVVGGGIVGLSVARAVATRGLTVHVLERATPPPSSDAIRIGERATQTEGAATSASLGVLSVPPSPRSQLGALYVRGLNYWPQFAETLMQATGVDPGYEACGGVHLSDASSSPHAREKRVRRYDENGFRLRWLDIEELRREFPGLSERYTDGFRIEEEGRVHPARVLAALRGSLTGPFARLRFGVGGARLELDGDRSGVRLENGDLCEATHVVVAAGAWSAEVIGAPFAEHLRLQPIRGQALEIPWTRKLRSNLHFQLDENDHKYYVIPRTSGRAWLGSTVEEVGFDVTTTEAGKLELIEAVQTIDPSIAAARVSRSWAGLRPKALRRGGPFLGRLPHCHNAWVACGHYRTGILAGPVAAELLVRQLLGEDDGESLAPFALTS